MLVLAKMKKLTRLENPNSVSQMKEYLEDKGLQVNSLGKKKVQAMLQEAPDNMKELLDLGSSPPKAA